MTTKTKGILERLKAGPVIGDGGFGATLEKRGYVKAGVWAPECTVNHPEAVRQLHREYLRSGADVMQAFNFAAASSTLKTKTQYDGKVVEKSIPAADINRAAYNLAREVADTGDALVSISLSQTYDYRIHHKGKEHVIEQFRQQLNFFKDCNVDIIICEYFSCVEEIEWAIEAAKETGKPVAATMCIGPHHDMKKVPTGDCAVRMAKAGADIVGLNCNFGPDITLRGMKIMKEALDKADLHPFLMVQFLGLLTPEIETDWGYIQLPEQHLACEPRVITRFEAQKYARQAYEMGVRYIGGCCLTEPHHIRAISEELAKERGKQAEVTKEFDEILSGYVNHPRSYYRSRATKEVWHNFEPSTGRPYSSALAKEVFSSDK